MPNEDEERVRGAAAASSPAPDLHTAFGIRRSAFPEVRQTRRAGPIHTGNLRDWSAFEIDLPIPDLAPGLDGLRILHLSDAHFGPHWSAGWDRLLAAVAAMDVDLIAFTGDWVEDKFDHRIGLDNALRFARGLRSRLGTFGVLGNHDGDLIAPRLLDAGVHLLVGETRRIVGVDAAIEIVGLPGVSRDDASAPMIDALDMPAPGTLRVVLTHYPDHARRLTNSGADLILSGHTHGGQVCLPGGRPILTHDSLGPQYGGGLHRYEGMWLHISRGLGCSMWPIRTWCPPEMTVIRMLKAE